MFYRLWDLSWTIIKKSNFNYVNSLMYYTCYMCGISRNQTHTHRYAQISIKEYTGTRKYTHRHTHTVVSSYRRITFLYFAWLYLFTFTLARAQISIGNARMLPSSQLFWKQYVSYMLLGNLVRRNNSDRWYGSGSDMLGN